MGADVQHLVVKKCCNYKNFHILVLVALCDAGFCLEHVDVGSHHSNNDVEIFRKQSCSKGLKHEQLQSQNHDNLGTLYRPTRYPAHYPTHYPPHYPTLPYTLPYTFPYTLLYTLPTHLPTHCPTHYPTH
jgi:hypothetical protein